MAFRPASIVTLLFTLFLVSLCWAEHSIDDPPSTTTSLATDATSFETTSTDDAQPSSPLPSVGSDNLRGLLLECAPCGKSNCSFSGGTNTSAEYSLTVGTPVANCQGGTSSIKSKIAESTTLGETWSQTATVGLGLGELKIEGELGWSQSKSITWGQQIEIEVEPGQKGVLVARVQYQQTSGLLRIGSREPYPLISNQPVKVVDFSAETVPCDSQFSAITLSSLNCPSSNSQMRNTPSMGIVIVMVLTVLGMFI